MGGDESSIQGGNGKWGEDSIRDGAWSPEGDTVSKGELRHWVIEAAMRRLWRMALERGMVRR